MIIFGFSQHKKRGMSANNSCAIAKLSHRNIVHKTNRFSVHLSFSTLSILCVKGLIVKMSGMLELFRFYSQSADIADANIDTSQLKIVKLNNWCLKFKESSTGKIFHNFCLHIKGYKKNPSNEQDIYWISSEIVEVRSERVLLSKSTAYYLAGEINKKESLAGGLIIFLIIVPEICKN
jgi:hypothetical protein